MELVWARLPWPPTLTVSSSVVVILNPSWALGSSRGRGSFIAIIQGPMLRRGPHARALMLCGCHLKLLIILSSGTIEHALGAWNLSFFTCCSTSHYLPISSRWVLDYHIPVIPYSLGPSFFTPSISIQWEPGHGEGQGQMLAPCSLSRWGMRMTILVPGS